MIFDIGKVALVIENATETSLINYFVDCSKSVCDLTTISGLIIGAGIGAVVTGFVYHISTKTSKQRQSAVYHNITWDLLSLRSSTKRLQKTAQQFKERYNKEVKIEDLESEISEIKRAAKEVTKIVATSRYDLSGKLISELLILYAKANLFTLIDSDQLVNSQYVIDAINDILNTRFKKYYDFISDKNRDTFKIFEKTRFDYEDEAK